MTIHQFGRVTPIQMTMLHLVGYRLSRTETTLSISDAERIANIVLARKDLCRTTGVDFKYKLSDWHRFLVAHEEYGYTHPYAFTGVKQAVLEAYSDNTRAILVSQIQVIEKSAVSIPRFGLVTPSQLAMLGLIGYRLSPTEAILAIPDDERLKHIVNAHHQLCKMTGIDLGYDLAAWHSYLIEHDDYYYVYPYAFEPVKQMVRRCNDDQERRDLISRLPKVSPLKDDA